MTMHRRTFLGSLAAPLLAAGASPVIDTHIHLFDPKRFPYHANATYKPEPETLDDYAKFVREAGITHAVIVHPEPYQDDHRYLEYCFEHEPSRGFFKGTCLYDAMSPETPARMAALVKKWPGRIVALRVHATTDRRQYPNRGAAIRDRDLASPEMRRTWRAASDNGLAVQVHMTTDYAPEVRKLATEFRGTTVVIDHLARAGERPLAQFDEVLRMAELPKVVMKFSAVRYSSKQPHPHRDVKPIVDRAYRAFGAGRIIWGGLGMNAKDYQLQREIFDTMFAEAPDEAKAQICGTTAQRLYRF